jgi:hypothetical protein
MGDEIRRVRVHVTLPEDIVAAVDGLAGAGGRSQFIADAVDLELRRRRLSAALEEMSGSLAEVDIPGWDTPESAAAWVRALRSGEPVPGHSITIDDRTS